MAVTCAGLVDRTMLWYDFGPFPRPNSHKHWQPARIDPTTMPNHMMNQIQLLYQIQHVCRCSIILSVSSYANFV